MCVITGVSSQCNTHKRTAAVADKHRKAQRYNRQWEYDGVGVAAFP